MTHIGFESTAPLGLSQISDTEFELTHTLVYYDGSGQVYRVPADTQTDLASVPNVLDGVFRRYGTYSAIAVVHDWLWRVAVPDGQLSYRRADQILREGLRLAKVKTVRRWMMWAAVRWGALTRPSGHQEWWRDAPAVLGMTVLSLPVVALPVAGTLPSILLLAAMEGVASLAERLVRRI